MVSKPEAKVPSFLSEEMEVERLFTPEDFSDEHRMIASLAEKFTVNQVIPLLGRLEGGEHELNVDLLRQAGELGLLGVDIPEEYGGLKLDKVSSTLIAEHIARGRSFNVTYSGQVGIGSLPIVYFGNKSQKETYLPGVVTGEKIGAYALTEPTSGTDALAAKTVATLSKCGKYYVLNGEKQFITNSGFADYFIVFAKIDREKFTAFIVPRDTDGLSTGHEEKKMGLKGSSTRSVILDNVKVPVENVLGEIGKGHVIAFNILNIGRHKIAATCLGNSKQAIELAVSYAKERKQFGKPISEFPLIRKMLAEMAIKTYVNESMIYRAADLMEQALAGSGENGREIAQALSRCAIECSITKVFSTEAYDRIIDGAVQIHGGYGFISEYEVETLYRDSRINRIFEGTNEINRMVIAANLLRQNVETEELVDQSVPPYFRQGNPLLCETEKLYHSKKMLRQAIQILKETEKDLNNEQELCDILANSAIDIFAIESALLRTQKACLKNGNQNESLKIAYTRAFVQETVQALALRFINMLPTIKPRNPFIEKIDFLLKDVSVDLISVKREIATKIIEVGKLCV